MDTKESVHWTSAHQCKQPKTAVPSTVLLLQQCTVKLCSVHIPRNNFNCMKLFFAKPAACDGQVLNTELESVSCILQCTVHYTLYCTLYSVQIHYTELSCQVLNMGPERSPRPGHGLLHKWQVRLNNCTVLHCTVLHWIVLHCTVLHCSVLHCTAVYSIVIQYIIT